MPRRRRSGFAGSGNGSATSGRCAMTSRQSDDSSGLTRAEPGCTDTADGIQRSIAHHLVFTLARDPLTASPRDWWWCTAHMVRDRIVERMIRTQATHHDANVRRVYYLSLEYLM